MKAKHLKIRIEQCLSLSQASNCPRRKFGAVLIDPERNTVLMDGYNGGPRGGGNLCGGDHCLRDGLTPNDVKIQNDNVSDVEIANPKNESFYVTVHGEEAPPFNGRTRYTKAKAKAFARLLLEKFPPIQSGTHVEIGCVHAEMNVICNCAYHGIPTKGAWLIVTGEPCLMCAKLIHHAGIIKVFAVGGGYLGENGIEYLQQHGIEVQFVSGPQDPRLAKGISGENADVIE